MSKHKCDTASNVERISTFVSPSETLSAEILWAIKVATVQHYSECSCDGAGNIFRRMFPDSHIAERFACGRTKCHYLTRFGIAPYFKNLLMQQIKDSGDVVVMFYESLNCITNLCNFVYFGKNAVPIGHGNLFWLDLKSHGKVMENDIPKRVVTLFSC